jgi:Cd2+/Zn2+-exporting ATPase
VFALKAAWESLGDRQLDVNFLMLLAAAGAIVVGRPGDAAILLFLFSLSSTLEELALGKTKSAIGALIRLRPLTALRVEGESRVKVAVEEIRRGDLVQVNPFDQIPLDGEIVEGASSVDASAMTGESRSESVEAGSAVLGGTQNLEGTIIVRITSTVGDNTLDQIVRLVDEAQARKGRGERISQWFGQRYTVFVVFAFLASWGIRLAVGQEPGSAFYQSLVLLVGLSPCALVISVPAATLSALTFAARRGILVRGGEVIEQAASIDRIAVDKTGTITKGKPKFVGAQALIGGDLVAWESGAVPESLGAALALVGAAEVHSSHPLAVALVRAIREAGVAVSETAQIEVIPGKGLLARLGEHTVTVGNDRLMIEQKFDLGRLENIAGEWRTLGRTTVWAGSDGFIAVFGFEDEIRPEAIAVLGVLKSLGVQEVVMLTGDKPETAKVVAERVGLATYFGGLLPENKSVRLDELLARGSVMMVGDGVNDAPSLARATVGVAMGGLGSQVALEASDVVLARDDLRGIPELIRLGRRTRGVIVANLVIAVGVIAALALASLFVALPLPLAVVGHEGSTLVVILNGLRLLRE